MQKDLQKPVQKIGTDAENYAEEKENGIDGENGADEFAEPDAEVVQIFVQSSVQMNLQMSVQIDFADVGAESGAAPAGRPVYRW